MWCGRFGPRTCSPNHWCHIFGRRKVKDRGILSRHARDICLLSVRPSLGRKRFLSFAHRRNGAWQLFKSFIKPVDGPHVRDAEVYGVTIDSEVDRGIRWDDRQVATPITLPKGGRANATRYAIPVIALPPHPSRMRNSLPRTGALPIMFRHTSPRHFRNPPL